MSINYTLVPNNLSTNGEDGYVARVNRVGNLSLADIIELMLEQGSALTRADILSVLESFVETMAQELSRGYNVSTPLVRFRPSIRGTFASHNDGFDRSRHRLWVSASAGTRLREAVERQAQPARQASARLFPQPELFLDVNGGSENGALTAGGLGRLAGERLRFEPDDPESGIFFSDASGNETPVTAVAVNMPTGLVFQIPALTPGEYTLLVRSRFGRELREGRLSQPLTMA